MTKKNLRRKTPDKPTKATAKPAEEVGGVKGYDPSKYKDWQHKGICSDF